jgi:hypothetical protein
MGMVAAATAAECFDEETLPPCRVFDHCWIALKRIEPQQTIMIGRLMFGANPKPFMICVERSRHHNPPHMRVAATLPHLDYEDCGGFGLQFPAAVQKVENGGVAGVTLAAACC